MNSTRTTKKPTRAQFESRLVKVRALQSEVDAQRTLFACKYGPGWASTWLSTGHRTKYENLHSRLSKAQDVFFDTLELVASRYWRAGIPVAWIIDNVTWDMATTWEAIPVPPLAWGHSGRNDIWAQALPAPQIPLAK